jgi:hypothetical protein
MIDWTLFKFDGPANRRYKILLPRTQTEISRLEKDLQLPALWQATIAELAKTYPPELVPAARPFCELRSTAHLYDGTPITIAMSGAIAPLESTHQLRALSGHLVVVAVPPEAEKELVTDLLRSRHDPSSNLAGVAFSGSHLLSIGANCTLQNVRECPRTTKLPLEPHPPEPWQLSASEQAQLDRAIGSLDEAFAKDQKILAKAREWRLGRTDITRHRRARPFESFVSDLPARTPSVIARALKKLEKDLLEYRYPYMAERLLTPAAFRHLKWLLQNHVRELARLRQQRLRALRALHTEQLVPAVAPAEKV